MLEEDEEPSEVSERSSELGGLHWLALSETTEMCWLFDVPWGHKDIVFLPSVLSIFYQVKGSDLAGDL